MNTEDNIYVNAADICLSMEYWPPAVDSIEIHAEVNQPPRMINLDEYTKKIQDDMMKALKAVLLCDNSDTRKKILGDDRTSVMTTIHQSSGHEFMERYEEWKKDEENKVLREQIDAAKKLLRENGFKVAEA